MKNRADLVRGLILKADSDLATASLCLDAGKALDTACFHAQQAAEKLVKASLIAYGIDYPFVHNIEKLIELCEKIDPAFRDIKQLGQELTPFAVELRYDHEFWPTHDTAMQAVHKANAIRDFIIGRLPEGMWPSPPRAD